MIFLVDWEHLDASEYSPHLRYRWVTKISISAYIGADYESKPYHSRQTMGGMTFRQVKAKVDL